jgi:hypothetical protein
MEQNMEDDLEAEDFDFNSMVCCVPLIGMAECILKARKIANDRLKKRDLSNPKSN